MDYIIISSSQEETTKHPKKMFALPERAHPITSFVFVTECPLCRRLLTSESVDSHFTYIPQYY